MHAHRGWATARTQGVTHAASPVPPGSRAHAQHARLLGTPWAIGPVCLRVERTRRRSGAAAGRGLRSRMRRAPPRAARVLYAPMCAAYEATPRSLQGMDAGYPGAYPGYPGANLQTIPINQLQSYFLEGMRPELAHLNRGRLHPQPQPQMQRTFTIRNDVNLKKNTPSLIRDAVRPSCYHLQFVFDASTDCASRCTTPPSSRRPTASSRERRPRPRPAPTLGHVSAGRSDPRLHGATARHTHFPVATRPRTAPPQPNGRGHCSRRTLPPEYAWCFCASASSL